MCSYPLLLLLEQNFWNLVLMKKRGYVAHRCRSWKYPSVWLLLRTSWRQHHKDMGEPNSKKGSQRNLAVSLFLFMTYSLLSHLWELGIMPPPSCAPSPICLPADTALRGSATMLEPSLKDKMEALSLWGWTSETSPSPFRCSRQIGCFSWLYEDLCCF